MPAAKQLNVEKAAATATKRKNAISPTIEVRAIARGQYGYPYARLIERGEVFKMAVKDLGKAMAGTHPLTGAPYQIYEDGDKAYGLPSWVVMATDEVAPDDDEEMVSTISGRPTKRGGQENSLDSDDVL